MGNTNKAPKRLNYINRCQTILVKITSSPRECLAQLETLITDIISNDDNIVCIMPPMNLYERYADVNQRITQYNAWINLGIQHDRPQVQIYFAMKIDMLKMHKRIMALEQTIEVAQKLK